MITPGDKEYIATRKIKKGEISPEPEMSLFIRWIGDTFGVTVLNLIHEKHDLSDDIRLQVIVEKESDMIPFMDGYNFDEAKQAEITREFTRRFSADAERLFVVFSSFAPIARQEANSRITEKEIEQLYNDIANDDLWMIRKNFSGATCFFFTEEQKEYYEQDDLRKEYSDRYYALISNYDEFGYIDPSDLLVSFDSKENFDTHYKGSWFNYDRG